MSDGGQLDAEILWSLVATGPGSKRAGGVQWTDKAGGLFPQREKYEEGGGVTQFAPSTVDQCLVSPCPLTLCVPRCASVSPSTKWEGDPAPSSKG